MVAAKRRAVVLVGLLLHVASAVRADPPLPLDTNILNFYQRGTQPGSLMPDNEIITAMNECAACHHNNTNTPIFREWSGSLMAQSARDPLFYACLDIAEADAPGSGDICIRCHAPKAWLEGRSTPTDGSAITRDDRDGITCNFCHRMVDPFPGPAPPEDPRQPIDDEILAALGIDQPQQSMDRGIPSLPGDSGGGAYVIDPFDRRRGPFPINRGSTTLPPPYVNCDNFHFGFTYGKCVDEFEQPTGCDTFESPFHTRSALCATCHDVSLPQFHYDSQTQSYVFNGQAQPHPSGNKYDMMPEQRTYSEWLKSDFAVGQGVSMPGRYGCDQDYVSDCQDCHQRPHNVRGCAFGSVVRPDIPHHRFLGASSWVLGAIGMHYGPDGPLPGHPEPDPINGPDLDAATVTSLAVTAEENARKILACAADLQVALDESQSPGVAKLRVRVINQTGHKLPTGYPEGRRMWLTAEFFDCTSYSVPMAVRGGYNLATDHLDEATTKVYEMKLGMDEALAGGLNRPAGVSSHAILSNKVYQDNRIPPRGFTNATFAAVQAEPVAYSYADGQYWDDTFFDIPAYAVAARVSLYYQSTSREYAEFLRDNNPLHGFDPTNRGQLAYDLWLAAGRSAPIRMAVWPPPALPDCNVTPDPDYPCGNPNAAVGLFHVELKGDLDGDRAVTPIDIPQFARVLVGLETDPRLICAADMDDANGPNGDDIILFVSQLLDP